MSVYRDATGERDERTDVATDGALVPFESAARPPFVPAGPEVHWLVAFEMRRADGRFALNSSVKQTRSARLSPFPRRRSSDERALSMTLRADLSCRRRFASSTRTRSMTAPPLLAMTWNRSKMISALRQCACTYT